mmetsp:Transcript_19420/g.29922  ORF Transcript_19420/g.29922 Transcript_19420/m.29922 type:complete len:277 (+) Transcript_19420:2011-2841(+)
MCIASRIYALQPEAGQELNSSPDRVDDPSLCCSCRCSFICIIAAVYLLPISLILASVARKIAITGDSTGSIMDSHFSIITRSRWYVFTNVRQRYEYDPASSESSAIAVLLSKVACVDDLRSSSFKSKNSSSAVVSLSSMLVSIVIPSTGSSDNEVAGTDDNNDSSVSFESKPTESTSATSSTPSASKGTSESTSFSGLASLPTPNAVVSSSEGGRSVSFSFNRRITSASNFAFSSFILSASRFNSSKISGFLAMAASISASKARHCIAASTYSSCE